MTSVHHFGQYLWKFRTDTKLPLPMDLSYRKHHQKCFKHTEQYTRWFCSQLFRRHIIFFKNFWETCVTFIKALDVIITERLGLKFFKCSFANNQTEYLGNLKENNSVRPLKEYSVAVTISQFQKQKRINVNFSEKLIFIMSLYHVLQLRKTH